MSVKAGRKFEQWVAAHLTARGVAVATVKQGEPFDLLANGVRLQCKSRSWTGANHKFQLRNARPYARDDFDFLVLRVDGEVYVLPAASIPGSDTHLGWHIHRSWCLEQSQCIGAWGLIDDHS